MIKRLLGGLVLVCALGVVGARAESLSSYVSACQKELDFSKLPSLDCNDGDLFATAQNGPSDPTNDYVGYAQVNGSVDLVYACRQMGNTNVPGASGSDAFTDGVYPIASKVEMIVHNKESGKTCFFYSKPNSVTAFVPADNASRTFKNTSSTSIVPPTSFSSTNPSADADSYWMQPDDVNTESQPFVGQRCAGCHATGPYIASPRIASTLAKYGLINNRHDTSGTLYTAVGSTFKDWNINFITAFSNHSGKAGATCYQCHALADNSPYQEPGFDLGFEPSIKSVATEIKNAGSANHIGNSESDYRWINRDGPGGTGDWETLANLQSEYPQLHCSNPVAVQAHPVGSDDVVSTDNLAQLPDKLLYFNLREGLVCRNSDQTDGNPCHEYQTRYMCGDTWTEWYNKDHGATGSGDFEQRFKVPLPCKLPSAIQAKADVETWGIVGTAGFPPTPIFGPIITSVIFNGPNDRLRYFDTKKGFACVNEDQPNGENCSNYVVRYICP